MKPEERSDGKALEGKGHAGSNNRREMFGEAYLASPLGLPRNRVPR